MYFHVYRKILHSLQAINLKLCTDVISILKMFMCPFAEEKITLQKKKMIFDKITLKCLSIGTPKTINFPFVSNGKLKFLDVPILKYNRYSILDFH